MYEKPSVVWRVPSLKDILENTLDGVPDNDMLNFYTEEINKKRKDWKPSPAAWQLLLRLNRGFLNKQVEIQIWDNIMHQLGEVGGPFPIRALCAVIITKDDDRIVQAYMGLSNPYPLKNESGFDCTKKYLTYSPIDKVYWLNFADIETIKIVE